MSFFADDFTGSDGTELSVHDASWAKAFGHTADAKISDSNTCRVNVSSADTAYRCTVAPASADYAASADIVVKTKAGNAGVMVRVQAAEQTYYLWRHNAPSNEWALFKRLAGTFTQIGGSVTQALVAGNTYNCKVQAVGSTISAFKEGSSTPSVTVTDTSIATAGFAGLRMFCALGNTSNLHLDNFAAEDIVVAVASPGVKLVGGDFLGSSTVSGAKLRGSDFASYGFDTTTSQSFEALAASTTQDVTATFAGAVAESVSAASTQGVTVTLNPSVGELGTLAASTDATLSSDTAADGESLTSAVTQGASLTTLGTLTETLAAVDGTNAVLGGSYDVVGWAQLRVAQSSIELHEVAESLTAADATGAGNPNDRARAETLSLADTFDADVTFSVSSTNEHLQITTLDRWFAVVSGTGVSTPVEIIAASDATDAVVSYVVATIETLVADEINDVELIEDSTASQDETADPQEMTDALLFIAGSLTEGTASAADTVAVQMVWGAAISNALAALDAPNATVDHLGGNPLILVTDPRFVSLVPARYWSNDMLIGPKDPAEGVVVTVEFAKELSAGETITSVSSRTVNLLSGTDAAPASILSGNAGASGTKVLQAIVGGVDGCAYELRVVATTSNNRTLVGTAEFKVETA